MGTFKFKDDIIKNHIQYELKTFRKLREPLNYIFETLEKLGHSITIDSLDKKINLNKLKEKEGKNYHWSVVKYKSVSLLIRRYSNHLTIFTKLVNEDKFSHSMTGGVGAFTFHPEFKYLTYSEQDRMNDMLYDKPFSELNKYINSLFTLLIERGAHWVDNSAAWKIPDYIDVKVAFDENRIQSVDLFIFCMEEIDSIHLELFAETTMLEKLEEFKSKIGEQFDYQYKIKRVENKVKNKYYHDAGILLEKEDGSTSFQDVYSLTRWYYDNIFVENN